MHDEIKNNLIVTYDKYARDRYRAKNVEWKTKEREKFLKHLKNENAERLLDLGAGPARDSVYFRDNGFNIICVDLSKEMARICRENRLDAAVMDIDNPGIADNSFDAVWSMNSLLHIPRDKFDRVLSYIKRILKSGGLFYLGMYGGRDFEGIWEDDFYTPHRFFSFYADDNLKKIMSRHFDIIEFTKIPLENRETDFQSLILRKVRE